MPLAAGTKLDIYEILGLLGAGGMGEVYRARDPALKREVAIKVLPSFVSRDPDRLKRFEQEAEAAAALSHPNILAVHQFGAFDGSPYLVSELLSGESLHNTLQRGPLPAGEGIRMNAIAPGVVDTPMHAPGSHGFLKQLHPIQRLAAEVWVPMEPLHWLRAIF